MPSLTLLGTAQDGGVPQAGCPCQRCINVLNGKTPELYPVAMGIIDDDGNYHLIEASRTLARQLHLWAKSTSHLGDAKPTISAISSLTLTHLHLGHVDGIGQFGREVIGASPNSIRLLAGQAVLDELHKRPSQMEPFEDQTIQHASRVELGKGVTLEFCRVPHREEECGETYGIIIECTSSSTSNSMPLAASPTSVSKVTRLLFLPDHDSYAETLEFHDCETIREFLNKFSIDVALLDGTFFTIGEVAVRREDAKGIPHPPIDESLGLLGERTNDDPEIMFIHFNHTNPVIDNMEKRLEIERMGWNIGVQGMTWEI